MSTPPPPPGKGYYRSLDGLRGIAIILVVLFHDFDYLPFFNFGWIGVDIFFVLSGFLITTTLLQTMDTPHPILLFYTKRVLRIFPIYYLSLVLLLFAIPLIIPDPAYTLTADKRPWFWFFLQNWAYILGKIRYSQAPHLRHFWSLALEEQYYLIWPWILLLIKRQRYVIRFILCILAALFIARFIIWRTGNISLTYYFFLLLRLEGLCIGSILAMAVFSNARSILKHLTTAFWCTLAACIIILSLRWSAIADIPLLGFGGYLLIALSVSLLIRRLLQSSRHFIFSNSLLVLAGRISFGWYIFHWPVYLLLRDPIENLLSSRIASSLGCILLSGLLACASYFGYEKYFLQWKKHLSFSRKGWAPDTRPPVNKQT